MMKKWHLVWCIIGLICFQMSLAADRVPSSNTTASNINVSNAHTTHTTTSDFATSGAKASAADASNAHNSGDVTSPQPIYPAFYVAIQPGYADMAYQKSRVARELSAGKVEFIDSSGFAARALMGYAFSPYVSTEWGYVYLPKVHFKRIDSGRAITFVQKIIDWTVKGTLPIAGGWAVYGKVGLAWVNRVHVDRNPKGWRAGRFFRRGATQYVPTISIGLTYDFNANVFGDVTFTRYFAAEDLAATNFESVGLGYRF